MRVCNSDALRLNLDQVAMAIVLNSPVVEFCNLIILSLMKMFQYVFIYDIFQICKRISSGPNNNPGHKCINCTNGDVDNQNKFNSRRVMVIYKILKTRDLLIFGGKEDNATYQNRMNRMIILSFCQLVFIQINWWAYNGHTFLGLFCALVGPKWYLCIKNCSTV